MQETWAGDAGSISRSGSSPGEGNGNLLQYSCLKNLMDREAWWATVHGVTKESDKTATKQQEQHFIEYPSIGISSVFLMIILGLCIFFWFGTFFHFTHCIFQIKEISFVPPPSPISLCLSLTCKFFLECIAYIGRRQWHPTPVLLPGKSHGWRSLVGCSPWGP